MTKKILLILCLIFSCGTITLPAMSTEIGFGYGQEFKENNDIEQYEVFVRLPLPYEKEFDSGFKVMTAVEISGGLIRERQSDNDEAGKITVMPQLILSPHPIVKGILGIGGGYMDGNTEFTDHDLGGPFLLASKVGVQILLGDHFNIGYIYFHQSNGGVYDYNAGLNMNYLLLSYSF